MKNYRIYYENSITINQTIELNPNDSHHIINVLRLKKDDNINIFNSNGEWLTQILVNHKVKTKLLVIKQLKAKPLLDKWVHLLYSPLKHIPNNFLITKATEIGVNELTQVITQNTNNKPLESNKILLKTKESAEQCERLTLPIVNKPLTLEKLINELNFNILWLNEYQIGKELNLHYLNSLEATTLSFLVGPEGGFSKKEVDILSTHKFITPIYLKGNILRAETASIVALSLSMYI